MAAAPHRASIYGGGDAGSALRRAGRRFCLFPSGYMESISLLPLWEQTARLPATCASGVLQRRRYQAYLNLAVAGRAAVNWGAALARLAATPGRERLYQAGTALLRTFSAVICPLPMLKTAVGGGRFGEILAFPFGALPFACCRRLPHPSPATRLAPWCLRRLRRYTSLPRFTSAAVLAGWTFSNRLRLSSPFAFSIGTMWFSFSAAHDTVQRMLLYNLRDAQRWENIAALRRSAWRGLGRHRGGSPPRCLPWTTHRAISPPPIPRFCMTSARLQALSSHQAAGEKHSDAGLGAGAGGGAWRSCAGRRLAYLDAHLLSCFLRGGEKYRYLLAVAAART